MNRQEIVDQIRECIVTATKNEDLRQLGEDDQFEAHDIDSLDRMSIMVEVEDKFEIDLEGTEPEQVTTIGAYAALVTKNQEPE